MAGLLILGLTVGCKAQIPPPSAPDPALNRRIEVMVRSQFDLPPDVRLNIGARKPSQFAGYETLPITITHSGKPQVVNFLISTDSTKLIHMDTFDLTKDPADAIPIAGRPIRGNPAAKVTVVNFDDLECPLLRAHARGTVSGAPWTITRTWCGSSTRTIRFTDLHPWAMHAAVDANCLAAQSGTVYWTYVDYLHAHGQEMTGDERDLAKSFAALDRIARQEATVGKLDETAPRCLHRQAGRDAGQSLGQAGRRLWGLMERRRSL